MMKSLQYYLMSRIETYPKNERESIRMKARLLSKSEYWAHRDRQFGYTSFLDLAPPELPAKLHYLYSSQERHLSEA